MNNDSLLEQEIKSEIESLKDLEVGSEKHKNAVDGVTKLMDRSI